MLCLSELHRPHFFCGVGPRGERAFGDRRFTVKNLCHDGLALGVCPGSGTDYRGHDQATEPEHFEFGADDPEGGRSRSHRTTTMRCGDESRVHSLARPDSGSFEQDTGNNLRKAARGVLRLSQRFVVLRPERRQSGAEVAKRLLHEAHVVTVPGEAFGTRDHIRLSYATSSQEIKRGLERMKEWFAKL